MSECLAVIRPKAGRARAKLHTFFMQRALARSVPHWVCLLRTGRTRSLASCAAQAAPTLESLLRAPLPEGAPQLLATTVLAARTGVLLDDAHLALAAQLGLALELQGARSSERDQVRERLVGKLAEAASGEQGSGTIAERCISAIRRSREARVELEGGASVRPDEDPLGQCDALCAASLARVCMDALAHAGRWVELVRCVYEAEQAGVAPSSEAGGLWVRWLASTGRGSEGVKVFQRLRHSGMELTSGTLEAVCLASAEGSSGAERVRELWETHMAALPGGIQTLSMGACEAYLHALARYGERGEALRVLERLERAGRTPSVGCFEGAMEAVAAAKHPWHTVTLWEESGQASDGMLRVVLSAAAREGLPLLAEEALGLCVDPVEAVPRWELVLTEDLWVDLLRSAATTSDLGRTVRWFADRIAGRPPAGWGLPRAVKHELNSGGQGVGWLPHSLGETSTWAPSVSVWDAPPPPPVAEAFEQVFRVLHTSAFRHISQPQEAPSIPLEEVVIEVGESDSDGTFLRNLTRLGIEVGGHDSDSEGDLPLPSTVASPPPGRVELPGGVLDESVSRLLSSSRPDLASFAMDVWLYSQSVGVALSAQSVSMFCSVLARADRQLEALELLEMLRGVEMLRAGVTALSEAGSGPYALEWLDATTDRFSPEERYVLLQAIIEGAGNDPELTVQVFEAMHLESQHGRLPLVRLETCHHALRAAGSHARADLAARVTGVMRQCGVVPNAETLGILRRAQEQARLSKSPAETHPIDTSGDEEDNGVVREPISTGAEPSVASESRWAVAVDTASTGRALKVGPLFGEQIKRVPVAPPSEGVVDVLREMIVSAMVPLAGVTATDFGKWNLSQFHGVHMTVPAASQVLEGMISAEPSRHDRELCRFIEYHRHHRLHRGGAISSASLPEALELAASNVSATVGSAACDRSLVSQAVLLQLSVKQLQELARNRGLPKSLSARECLVASLLTDWQHPVLEGGWGDLAQWGPEQVRQELLHGTAALKLLGGQVGGEKGWSVSHGANPTMRVALVEKTPKASAEIVRAALRELPEMHSLSQAVKSRGAAVAVGTALHFAAVSRSE
jgi:hypothetical protein